MDMSQKIRWLRFQYRILPFLSYSFFWMYPHISFLRGKIQVQHMFYPGVFIVFPQESPNHIILVICFFDHFPKPFLRNGHHELSHPGMPKQHRRPGLLQDKCSCHCLDDPHEKDSPAGTLGPAGRSECRGMSFTFYDIVDLESQLGTSMIYIELIIVISESVSQ